MEDGDSGQTGLSVISLAVPDVANVSDFVIHPNQSMVEQNAEEKVSRREHAMNTLAKVWSCYLKMFLLLAVA